MPGFSHKSDTAKCRRNGWLVLLQVYPAAFSIGGEAKRSIGGEAKRSTGGEAKRSIGVKAKRLIGGEKKEEYQCT